MSSSIEHPRFTSNLHEMETHEALIVNVDVDNYPYNAFEPCF